MKTKSSWRKRRALFRICIAGRSGHRRQAFRLCAAWYLSIRRKQMHSYSLPDDRRNHGIDHRRRYCRRCQDSLCEPQSQAGSRSQAASRRKWHGPDGVQTGTVPDHIRRDWVFCMSMWLSEMLQEE